MPPTNLTEDIEFLTDVDAQGDVVRRGRFIQRPRRVNGRTVPGNARYYRRRQNELLSARRAAQRGGTAGRAASAAGRATTAPARAPRRPAAPAAGERRSGGGVVNRIRRAARNAARNVESRARARRESRNRR